MSDTKRGNAIWHIRMAIWHAEAAMAADSESWDYTDVNDCRDARDTNKNLLDILDTDSKE